MGWFVYDDLLKRGKAESQGFTVYTPDFWKANRNTEIERCMKQWFSKRDLFAAVTDTKEVEHRRMLGLPENGAVLKSEIEQAYRVAARRAHPDVGGSDDEFKRLAAAKDALIIRWQR
jgi:hypothetical protein